MKPVASGCVRTADGLRNEDALMLQDAMNVPARYDEVNPYAFEPAIAPHIAARESGRVIDLALLDRCYSALALRSDVLVVEGAGGWLSPLDATLSFADLAMRWQLDVILVVALRLGCLNHALLTAESVARRGLRLLGWVGNSVQAEFERRAENIDTLRARLGAPCLATFPYAPAATPADFSTAMRSSLPELDRSFRP
jgi:dethiobiotin synthetase